MGGEEKDGVGGGIEHDLSPHCYMFFIEHIHHHGNPVFKKIYAVNL